jgi:hypothetical protein
LLTAHLDAPQSRAFRMVRPGRTCVFPFGRGSGKTFLDRVLIHSLALSHPGIELGILYPTLVQARQVIWPGLFSDYAGPLKAHAQPPNRTGLWCVYRNGSRVTTWGAENIDSVRGQRFGALFEDEADDIDPDLESAAVEPTFSRSGREAIWVKTGTFRRGRYGGLYRDFRLAQEQAAGNYRNAFGELVHEPHRTPSHYGFVLKSSDSPQVDQAWLSGIRTRLYAAGRGTIYEREYECNPDAADGLVYSVFNQATHVREADYGVRWTEILVGVDHGWEDPGVFLVAGVIGTGRDAIIHVLEEVYEPHRETSWWQAKAVEVATKYRSYRQRWYADPSRPDSITSIRRAIREACIDGSHISVEEAVNDIEPGVDAVADRLAPRTEEGGAEVARLYIAPCCRNTIEEFGKYRRKRDPKNSERVLDDIQDKDNHAMDGIRYLVLTRFGGPDRRRHEVGPVPRTYPETA